MTHTLSTFCRRKLWCCLPVGLVVLLPSLGSGADPDDNYRVSFSLGAAFNVSAKFRGHPGIPNMQNPQGQSGTAYFDNGYVGPDVSGDASLTTFWGYNRADQPIIASGNVLGLNYERTMVTPDSTSPRLDADPSPSGEILVRRRIANSGCVTFGVEFGASYTRFDLDDNSRYTTDGQRTGYSFGLPSPVDADLFPPAGYQGPFNGLGPNLSLGQTTGQTLTIPGAVAVSGTRRVEADILGFRLGPYLEFPFNEKFAASISGGAVVALIADRVTWNENVSVNSATDNGYWTGQTSARGSQCGEAYGYFVSADVSYSVNDQWSTVAGCRFQGLGTYKHKIGEGEMQLDLGQSFIVSLAVRYSF
jgi:hypothetical protein